MEVSAVVTAGIDMMQEVVSAVIYSVTDKKETPKESKENRVANWY